MSRHTRRPHVHESFTRWLLPRLLLLAAAGVAIGVASYVVAYACVPIPQRGNGLIWLFDHLR